MAKKKKITMTVEKTDTGFSAFSEDYPIFTTGQSIPEKSNQQHLRGDGILLRGRGDKA